MSCFHPLKGFKIGYHPSGKPNYMITSYDTEFVKYDHDRWVPCSQRLVSDFAYPVVSDSIDIPCGHCIGCYLDRSRQWADRCMLEALDHDSNCFITLTFDEYHLHKLLRNTDYCDEDGVMHPSPFFSNDKSLFQDFMKRLRSKLDYKYGIKIRYFACSEYGTESFRPHFHAIIFGYDFSDDRTFYKCNWNGDKLYTSKLLCDCWPYGFSTIGSCDWNSCSYVARYCLKKRDNDLKYFYDTFNLEPESVFMSRKPGIARNYYNDHVNDIYKYESIVIPNSNGRKCRPPRYFDKLYDVEYPEDMQRIKDKRMAASIEMKNQILNNTDLSYIDYLAIKEDNMHNRTKILQERKVKI